MDLSCGKVVVVYCSKSLFREGLSREFTFTVKARAAFKLSSMATAGGLRGPPPESADRQKMHLWDWLDGSAAGSMPTALAGSHVRFLAPVLTGSVTTVPGLQPPVWTLRSLH